MNNPAIYTIHTNRLTMPCTTHYQLTATAA